MSQSFGQGPNPNEQGNFTPPPPPPPPPGYYPQYAPAPMPAPEKKGFGATWMGRAASGLMVSILMFSLVLNVYFAVLFAAQLTGPVETTWREGNRTSKVVILPVRGAIDDDTAGFMITTLRTLMEEPPKAIVLRIDSPGGGVSPSDRIYHELEKFKQAHPTVPIVASYGSIAASGGYYISANADEIVAEPTTITGSIGVIAQAFTVQDLLQKIGVTPEIITSTKSESKDTLSPFRAWTEKDRSILRGILDSAHNRFIDIVYDGRKENLTRDQVEKLASGAVFTTKQAIDNKLVDTEGYLEDAIAVAIKRANIPADSWVVSIHPARQGGLLGLLSGSAPSVPTNITGEQIRKLMGELSVPRLEFTVQQ